MLQILLLRSREATARVAWKAYLHDPQLPKHLHRVRQPVLLLWGHDDRLIPVEHGRRYKALIPGATLRIFDGTGHMLPLARTKEFVDATLTFLIRSNKY